MKELKKRIAFTYVLIVAAAIMLLYFLMTNIVEVRVSEEQMIRFEDDLTTLIQYVYENQNENDLNATDVIQSLRNVSPAINDRITFLNLEGEPLYDSETAVAGLDNMWEQREIQQVLYGEDIGVAVRKSPTTAVEQYYLAKTIQNEAGESIGIIRLSNDAANISPITNQVVWGQFIGMALLASVLIFITRNWLKNLSKAVTNMDEVVTELKEANYDARYEEHTVDDLNHLGYAINELAVNLESQRSQLESSEKRTFGLINHLIIGVMLLDDNRRIQMVNPVMNELLGVNLYGKITHLYTDYVTSAELIELIEEAYALEDTVNAEISMYFPEEKRLDVNIVPVPGTSPEETHYIVLLYDITEIRRLEQVRSAFAANVSHELRTPITALKGFSETLLDGAMYDDEVLKEFLEIMLKESSRLDAMVQDILQLSRLEQGHERFSVERIVIRDVVEEVFQILQQKILLKRIATHIDDKEVVAIQANRNHLKQILMNLIANAIAYTPEDGKVVVAIDEIGDQARIQVIDNGIGIPTEDQGRIFERFYRVDKARSRNAGGTGLGLSIVKWVVDTMDGRVELFSEEDVGTTFVVWLPLDKEPL